ncbi:MAG TPA: HAMP domain-containing sensor histidine kinase [Gemmatimonadales bacterium]|nr:HAMP domain-containing sensor histidine kinase [Gemmatimonadales bacterium]
MRLSFHRRILLILICLGALPTAVAILGWGLTIRASGPTVGPRQALEEVGASGRSLLETIDTTRLAPAERAALAAHAATLNSALGRFQRAETFGRYYYAGLALAVLALGAAFLYASVRLGGHLSRQLSRPIEELIGWTGNIRRNEPLPADRPRRGAPEFAALRTALREMAEALERGRAREIEAERLRAFRETARRVAHEMRNPLTPIRLAVAQLARGAGPESQREAIEVLTAESGRLEQLAREFTEFGRLPEGPAAPVDLVELLEDLARTTLPPSMTPRLSLDPATPQLLGHYDPLRRAFSNILRNAVEACGGQGTIEIAAAAADGGARVTVRDHGPGIPPELEDRIFEPYCTGKEGGTGLGLALAKQTVELHHGTISVGATPGGGATFVVTLQGR